MKMSPAALKALADGDSRNFMVAVLPGGIEAQEAQGQKDMVKSSDRIPKNMDPSREDFEKLGIVIRGDADDIFYNAELPEGWSLQLTNHSMWSELVDDKGRVRAMIFYKAAFYARSAKISMNTRFTVTCDYDEDTRISYAVRDAAGEKNVFEVPICSEYGDEEGVLARNWLDENYPDHRNPMSYWNEEEGG